MGKREREPDTPVSDLFPTKATGQEYGNSILFFVVMWFFICHTFLGHPIQPLL